MTTTTDFARERLDAARTDEFLRLAEVTFGFAHDEESRKAWSALLADGETFGAVDRDKLIGIVAFFGSHQVLPGGAAVPTQLVSYVATLPTHRRRGVMTALLGSRAREWHDEDVATSVLWASESGIYRRFGFGPASRWARFQIDPRRFAADAEVARMADSAEVTMELTTPAELESDARQLHDRVATQVPGAVLRTDPFWERWHTLGEFVMEPSKTRVLVAARSADGELQGWVDYRRKPPGGAAEDDGNICEVDELWGTTPAVEIALWRFVAALDLVTSVLTPWTLAIDDPVLRVAADHRAVRITPPGAGDAMWVRICDVPRVLRERSYRSDGELTIAVDDPLDVGSGCWRLQVQAGAATVTEAKHTDADLSLRLDDLAPLVFGDASAAELARANRLEADDPAARARADILLGTDRLPRCALDF